MVFGIIYKVFNNMNGKIYIGQTIAGLCKRKRDHILEAMRCSYKSYFHRALNKYGKGNFTWEIIENCDSKVELDEMEFHYIKQYNSYSKGYNLTLGGEGSPGVVRTKEVRQKISNSLKGENCYWYGKHYSDSTKKKISNKLKGSNHPNFNKKRDPLIVQKSAESNRGKKRTIEQKQRMSRAHIGKYIGNKSPCAKKYVITTLEGNTFIIHGLTNFCKLYRKEKLNCNNMSQCATGKRRHHKGYLCRYYSVLIDFNISEWEGV